VLVRSRLPLLTVLALVVALLALPTPPESEATTNPRPSAVVPVAPGVARAEYRLTKPSGSPVVAQVLTVTPTEGVRLTSALANGVVPGLEDIRTMNQRLQPQGAVAVINSGFWLNRPVGSPESYFATGGRLISESETQGVTQRGTFALSPDGVPLMDRILARVHLNVAGEPHLVTGLNRLDRKFADLNGDPHPHNDADDALYVYTPEYGGQVTLPSTFSGERDRARSMVLPGIVVPASRGASVPSPATVSSAAQPGTSIAIPRDGLVLVGYNRRADELAEIPPAAPVRAVTQISTEATDPAPWDAVGEAVAAGPLLVREGAITDPRTWEQEGFSDQGHSRPTSPRSAVGFDRDGRIFLVAVDGRQPDHSVGMTMAELAQFLIDLGAWHGMALDGGGSTQLSIDGVIRNSPCQSASSCGPLRPVASGIVVHHDYDYDATLRLAGDGREATAAEIALATYPEGADQAVLAPGGDFPDALAGGPRASQLGAPLLLAGRDALAPATRAALRELGVRRITLLGGTAVISPELSQRLVDEGYEVRRLAGGGRVETAAAIANAMGTEHPRIFVASADGFADALSAAAPAGILRAPILLTGRDRLGDATRDVIAASRPVEVVVVGGTAVISSRVETEIRALNPAMTVRRLAGEDRYGTALAINDWAEATIPDLDATTLVVALGDTFPDALAGGPFAAAQRRLLMIVPSWDVRAASGAATYLDRRGAGPLEEVTLLGGFSVLTSYQQWQLDQLAR
jgi:putative cell wall-binding protein